jgi:hypothetical protein
VSAPWPRTRSQWLSDAAADVVAAKGEWVLVARGVSNNVAWRIKTGVYAAFRPAGRFEATTRRVSEGSSTVNVWARDTQGS